MSKTPTLSSQNSSTADVTFTTPIPKFPTDPQLHQNLSGLLGRLMSVLTTRTDKKEPPVNATDQHKREASLESRKISCMSYTYENLHFTDESGMALRPSNLTGVQLHQELITADIVSLSSDDDEMEFNEDSICILQDLYEYYNPYKPGASSTGYASNFVLYDIPEEGDFDDESSGNFVEILKI